jgi:hypothetical protein
MTAPGALAPDLVTELDHAVPVGARPGQLHCPVREPTLEERLADAQRDWDHRQVHLVQERSSANCEATLPPPTTHSTRSPAAAAISL